MTRILSWVIVFIAVVLGVVAGWAIPAQGQVHGESAERSRVL